ncbi:hypothetical protein GN958_ATG21445 [Phytophthora infestans]|uniref:Uncharacterized protein n=1 Tax=Phytophthora infestans TaxID=4787 RepID=A0A8S9TLN1_PHYIN|nr:hypothetical protein GN958_ATG21445 [Phytophthora infestans]
MGISVPRQLRFRLKPALPSHFEMVSNRAKPSLPDRGYQVVYLGLSNRVLAGLLNEAKERDYRSVFAEVGAENDDSFRAQSRVNPRESSAAINELSRALRASTACMDPRWIPREFSYMR